MGAYAGITPKQVGLVADIPNQMMGSTLGLPYPLENYRLIRFSQTWPGVSMSLPALTNTNVHVSIDLINVGTIVMSVAGLTLNPQKLVRVHWTGTSWADSVPNSAGTTPSLKILGYYYPAQDRVDDFATLATIPGGLPTSTATGNGNGYIIVNTTKAALLTSPNLGLSQDLYAGDLLVSLGVGYGIITGGDKGYAHSQVSTSTPSVGISGLTLRNGDLWFNPTSKALSVYNSGAWSSTLPKLNVVGYWNVNPDFTTDLYGGLTGMLPAPNTVPVGTAYISNKNAAASQWNLVGVPFATTMPSDLIAGDLIVNSGTSYVTVRLNNRYSGSGDIQSAASAPTKRSTNHPLQEGDLWLNSSRKDLKIRSGAAWNNVDDPISALSTAAAYTTSKSESVLLLTSGANLTLNSTPETGEHVRIYLPPKSNTDILVASVKNISTHDATSSTSETYNSNDFMLVDFVYDGTNWIETPTFSPEKYADGASTSVSASPAASYSKDTIHVSSTPGPRTLNRTQIYDVDTSTLYPILADTSLASVSKVEFISAATATLSPSTNQQYLLTGSASTITLTDGLYDGQTIEMIRANSWNSTGFILLSSPAGRLDYPAGSNLGSDISAVRCIWNATTTKWVVTFSTYVKDAVSSSSPATADNCIPRFDGISGRIIQKSNLTVDDNNDMLGCRNLTISGRLVAGYQVVSPSAGVFTIDCGRFGYFELTTTVPAVHTLNFTNLPTTSSSVFLITMVVKLVSGSSISWPSINWPGGSAPTLTAGKTHMITLLTSNGGTTWRATLSLDHNG